MSKPFGAMPADREIAAFGCGFGAVILGAAIPRAVTIVSGRPVFVAGAHMPWWFSALFAAIGVVVAMRVTGWALRSALVLFTVGRVLSIESVARVLAVGAATLTVSNCLCACFLIVAAWPHTSPRARLVAVALFALFVALGMWLVTW